MPEAHLTTASFISIAVLVVVYGFLIAEKVNKVLVVSAGALFLILAQIFKTSGLASQAGAFSFIANNLDLLGFIIGMMVLVGIVKESGFFEAIAIWLIRAVKGRPIPLLIVMGFFILGMTIILPNIIATLVVTPILVILIKEFKFPALPYFLIMIAMANIGGATTPISDPTTFYMAKTVGLTFGQVVVNSGLLVLVLALISLAYTLLLFWKQLKRVKVNPEDFAQFNPKSAIKNRTILKFGVPILFIAIALMALSNNISQWTGVTLDDATIALAAAVLCMSIFKVEVDRVFSELIDWQILFFFMGLFVVVGALQQTGVVGVIGHAMVSATHGSVILLVFMIAVGSGVLSTFIDNVPYNIAMIAAIQAMEKSGINVYPLWWALNLGTSLGGAGSPIGSAANVIALGQAEKEGIHIKFTKYLAYGFPLVIINGLVTFGILYVRFGILQH
jgi:Na+/H+ antiporter NhaD/arsenite permease-like protein